MTKIIENARLINGNKITIVIKDGKIVDVTNKYEGTGQKIMLPNNVYVSPGWIDLHTHSFPKYKPYCANPDEVGYKTGVTTVVDAGSAGAYDLDEFYGITRQCKTRVYSFLNISPIGLKVRNELSDLSILSSELIEEANRKYPELIVGLKARISASVVGNNGVKPLEIGKQFSRKIDKPLMVHIGNAPPKISNILPLLDKGDIVTHCFNHKQSNHLFTQCEKVEKELLDAIRRGIYLDIGHGTSSFSYAIARKAKERGIPFHSISTDIYEENRVNGPVYNMATTLSKFLSLGYSLETIIKAVTETPARMIRQDKIGALKKGNHADLTFFHIKEKEKVLKDSIGNELVVKKQIIPHAVMIGGIYYEC